MLEIWRNLRNKQDEHIKQYKDAISIFDSHHIDAEIQSEETRSFKGIYPITKERLQKTKKWLEAQGFETSQVTHDFFYMVYYILARKNSEKGCIVYLTKTQGKRIWADIQFKIIGNDWSTEEIKDMQNSFWNQFTDTENLV